MLQELKVLSKVGLVREVEEVKIQEVFRRGQFRSISSPHNSAIFLVCEIEAFLSGMLILLRIE